MTETTTGGICQSMTAVIVFLQCIPTIRRHAAYLLEAVRNVHLTDPGKSMILGVIIFHIVLLCKEHDMMLCFRLIWS